jgi:hypothetical protein
MESDRSIERQWAARISGLRKCSDHRDSWHAAHQFWLIVDRNIDGLLGLVCCGASVLGVAARHGVVHDAGSYRSGQTGQTVNLMAYAFAGSNPALPNAGKVKCLELSVECQSKLMTLNTQLSTLNT